MSLGSGALKVTGVTAAMCREGFPWQPWKREPPKNTLLQVLGEWKDLGNRVAWDLLSLQGKPQSTGMVTSNQNEEVGMDVRTACPSNGN